MAQQRPDICFIQGTAYALSNFPLDQLLAAVGLEPDIDELNRPPACWRGYVATWALEDGRQYLLGVRRFDDQGPARFRPTQKVRHRLDDTAGSSPRLGSRLAEAARQWLLAERRPPLPLGDGELPLQLN